MTSGDIGAYKWIECVPSHTPALFDAIRNIRGHLIGLLAVNVSWDSGLFVPSDDERAQGWAIKEDRAVSPLIDDEVINHWPWCDGGFEEWYFFPRLPQDLKLAAYCNWMGLSVGDWPRLVDVPRGLDLRQQLEKTRPSAVLGIGGRLFAISQDAALIEDFGRALGEV